MKKKNIVLIVVLFVILYACNTSQTIKLQETAKKNADYIIDNLDKQEIINQFPKEFFPNTLQIKQFIDEMRFQCEYKFRIGKYVDQFIERNLGAKEDRISFIYEYYLQCDSLRFTLTYTLRDSVVLSGLLYQKLGEKNPMIIDPDKKLENSSFNFSQKYDNGNLLFEGQILNGKKNGIWKNYYENGSLCDEISYKNDLYNGPVKSYYQSSNIRTIGQHVNNKEVGRWISYYEDGKKARESNYENGDLIMDYYFDEGENPISIKEFKKLKKNKFMTARENADFIINNLTEPGILKEFPDKNFPMESKNQVNQLLITLSNLCEYPIGEKVYITDYYSASFEDFYIIYEAYLKCDTLRFSLTYNIKEKPELTIFSYESAEVKNDLLKSALDQNEE